MVKLPTNYWVCNTAVMYSMYYTFDNNLSFVYPSINWCMFTHIPSSITYHLQTSNMTCWSFSWLIMWTGQEKKDSLICICEVSVMTCFYSVTYSDLSSLELLKVSLLPLSTPHLVTVISSHHLWLFYSNHHFTSVRPSSASPSFPQHFITSTLLQLFLSLLLCLLESSFLYLGCFLSCLFVSPTRTLLPSLHVFSVINTFPHRVLSDLISTLSAIVGTHMYLEVDFLSEALGTSRASIGSLPSMDADVSLEVGGKGKFFATHVTGVWWFLPMRNRNRSLGHLKEISRRC